MTYNWIAQGIDWTGDTIKAMILTDSYVPSTSHEHLDDVEAYDAGLDVKTLTTSQSFTDITLTLDAEDLQWTAATATGVRYLCIYKDTGSSATSRLMFLFDIGDNGAGRDITNAQIDMVFPATGVYKQRYY